MTRRVRFRLVLSLLAVAVLGFSPCGAEDKDSPTKDRPPAPETCQTFDQLAPHLHAALQGDQLTGIRGLVDQLSQPPAEGGEPAVSQVLQALFVALHEFAEDPPEAGNTDGLCNMDQPPPLNETNRLCDLRRILKLYIHEGKASQSLHAFDPVLAGTLNYINGVQPSADHPHYEIARNLEVMCTETGQCNPHDTFDLLQGVTAYLTPGRSQQTLAHVQTLIDDPLLTGPSGLLSSLAAGSADGGSNPSAEQGFEFLANELICALGEVNPRDPNPFASIDQLLTGTLYPVIDQNYPPQDIALADGGVFHSDLHTEIATGATDLKAMLDPNLSEPILQPLQKTLQCATVQAPSGVSVCGRALRPGFVPMIYHLGFEAKVVGLDQILGAMNELVATDAQSEEPGMVMKILHDIVAALNRDDEALGAVTNLCHVAFQTERPCDDGQGDDCPALPLNYFPPPNNYAPHLDACVNGAGASYGVPAPACLSNAEAVTPEVGQLFREGVTDEAFCVLDALVYGCTGGPGPACSGGAN